MTNLKTIFTFYIYKCRGLEFDINNSLHRTTKFTWPHKVALGQHNILEHGVYFKHDGPYSKGKSIILGNNNFVGSYCEFNIKEKIIIEDNCLIGSGSKFIDHDHGLSLDSRMKDQVCPSAPILIKNDIWIGANVVVLKGVTIESGAVVAAGAVVTKSIPAYEIWGGVPAKKIGIRE